MRFFTTAGPVKPARHYCIPPIERLDLGDVLALIRDETYFVLHTPRQTGKMGDFSQDEVRALLGQHTEETGQAFTADALSRTEI